MWDLVFRKIAHMAEFFVLAYLLYRALRLHGLSHAQCLWIAILASISYAGFDEWHQGWVKGRVSSPIDVGIDSLGVITFGILKQYIK